MINFFANLKNKDLIYLFFLVFLFKLPTMDLPYYWDELVYVSHAKYYSIFGLLSIPPGDVGHVRLFSWILTFSFKIFGESNFLSHLIVVLFSFIAVAFTYLLGKFLYDRKVGVMASLLLFFSSVYFAMSGQALYDIPLTAFTVMTLYFALRKRTSLYLLSGIFLVLTKEPGILVILAILLYQLIKRQKLHNIFVYSIPLFAILIWNIWYWSVTGYFGFRNVDVFVFTGFSMMIKKIFSNIYQVFFWNYHWLLSLIIFIIFFVKKKFIKKISLNNLKHNSTPLILTSVLFILFFSYSLLLPRYLIPIYPIFFILSAYSLEFLFKKKTFLVLLLIIFLFMSCYRWNDNVKGFIQDPVFHSTIFHPKIITSVFNGELSLDYIDVVNLEKSAMNFIFKNYPNSKIIAVFPIVHPKGFENFDIGYRQWTKYNVTIIRNTSISSMDLSGVDLIVYETACRCWEKEDEEFLMKMKLVKKFESNNRFISIFKP